MKRPWYTQLRYLVPLAFALFGIAAIASSMPASNPPAQQAASAYTASLATEQPAEQPAVAEPVLTAPRSVPTVAKPAPTPAPQEQAVAPTPLSNDNYYTNVDGQEVHAPASAPSVPAGASAQCRDGTYSFSTHRSGTCSHHGGVASWL